jgi:hypothetical protein
MSSMTDTKHESFSLLLDLASSTTRATLNINDEEPRLECRIQTRGRHMTIGRATRMQRVEMLGSDEHVVDLVESTPCSVRVVG